MSLYFAYGSNMVVADMRVRCPGAHMVGVACLDGYAFFVGADGWASVHPQRGQAVHGVLWQVTPDDVAALDVYEGVGEGLYDRHPVTVSAGGVPATAMIYRLRRSEPGRAPSGYLDPIVAAARAFDFPPDYVRSVEAWRM